MKKYFITFFEEKDLAYQSWEIEHNGQTHFIDSDFVKELIITSGERGQRQIKDILVKLDFANGDINHFLKHLAEAYIKSNY